MLDTETAQPYASSVSLLFVSSFTLHYLFLPLHFGLSTNIFQYLKYRLFHPHQEWPLMQYNAWCELLDMDFFLLRIQPSKTFGYSEYSAHA